MTDHPEDSSCELPDAPPADGRRHRAFDSEAFAWEGVAPRAYKLGGSSAAGAAWKDVVRHTLTGSPGDPAAFQLRYFEIGPGGYSSLEKHRHVHTILVLRGAGVVVVGREVFRVGPFDILSVPPSTPHQFVNDGREPFGFLCPVDAERDAPQPLTVEELDALLAIPQVRAAIRVDQTAGMRE